MERKMKTFIMMIGLPASGKSTIINSLFKNFVVCSSDNYIEKYAMQNKKTYNEVFKEVADEANKDFFKQLNSCLGAGVDVVVDRTNLSVNSRKKILSLVPASYYRSAYVISCKDASEWKKRLTARPGKNIPENVLNSMNSSYQCPQFSEGFDHIYYINT